MNDFDFIEIESIEDDGEEIVYDLNVPNTACFFANDILVHNCSELVLAASDACRLLLVNSTSYVIDGFRPFAKFDYKLFHEHTRIALRLLDDMVDLEIEAVDRIIAKIHSDKEPDHIKSVELNMWQKIRQMNVDGRRVGLGITGIADVIAMMGMKYGSSDAIEFTETVYRELEVAAHIESVNLAEERGAFPACEPSRYERSHPFFDRLKPFIPADVWKKFTTIGRRNIGLTTSSPAGTVSIVAQTSSGIEPVYMLSYKRRKKVMNRDDNSDNIIIDEMGDRWQEYSVEHPGLKRWMDITGENDITKSPYYGATAMDVDWHGSVKLQAAAQKFVESSISKTCNLPITTSQELISQAYIEAWKSGCKGFTVYRDGSRTGVLVNDNEKNVIDNQPSEIFDTHAPKRPKELKCDIHRVTAQGETYLVLVGLLNDRPYEIFAGLSQYVEVPKKIKTGILVKNKKNKEGIVTYSMRIPIGSDDQLVFNDIVNLFDNPHYGTLTRMISLSIRHGIPMQYLVEQLRKDKHSDITSFSNVIARVLSRNYIPDGTKTLDRTCPQCESTNMQYQSGCVSCADCLWSKCA